VEDTRKLFQPARWFWAFVYGWVFLWEMIKANFDVAYRVVHPRMPIRPGIVKVRTRIRSEMGRVFLANSITLTPGTFTVDIKDDVLYIHWIFVRHTDLEKASENIVGPFESLLIRIFD
jgi:multicomponent Na+:H+ antiporter subunit E